MNVIQNRRVTLTSSSKVSSASLLCGIDSNMVRERKMFVVSETKSCVVSQGGLRVVSKMKSVVVSQGGQQDEEHRGVSGWSSDEEHRGASGWFQGGQQDEEQCLRVVSETKSMVVSQGGLRVVRETKNMVVSQGGLKVVIKTKSSVSGWSSRRRAVSQGGHPDEEQCLRVVIEMKSSVSGVSQDGQ